MNTVGRWKKIRMKEIIKQGMMDGKKILFIGLLTSMILLFSLGSSYAVKLDEGVYGGSGSGDWSCTPGGPIKDSVCGVHLNSLPSFPKPLFDKFQYTHGAIEICDPEPPIQSKIHEWILSDPALKAEVLAGSYDNSVRKIFDEAFELYFTNGVSDVSSCDPIPPHMLIDGTNPHGVCIHWASAVFSLIRTLGVPADRAYIVSFGTSSNSGHSIVMYKSDAGGWYAIDVTACQAMVEVGAGGSIWFNECGSLCTCSVDRGI